MALTYRATGLYTTSAATCVIPKPTGLAVGDLMIAVIRRAAVVTPTGTPSANWSLVSSQLTTYGTWVYECTATATEVAATSFTFTWAASAVQMGQIHAYYGPYDTATPIAVTGTWYQSSTAAVTITIPTITTNQATQTVLLIATAYRSSSTVTFAVPTSPAYSEGYDNGGNTFYGSIAKYEYPTSGTATGALAYTASSSSANYRTGIAIAIDNLPKLAINKSDSIAVTTTTTLGLTLANIKINEDDTVGVTDNENENISSPPDGPDISSAIDTSSVTGTATVVLGPLPSLTIAASDTVGVIEPSATATLFFDDFNVPDYTNNSATWNGTGSSVQPVGGVLYTNTSACGHAEVG